MDSLWQELQSRSGEDLTAVILDSLADGIAFTDFQNQEGPDVTI